MGLAEVFVTSSSKSLVQLALLKSLNAFSLSARILIFIGTCFGILSSSSLSAWAWAFVLPELKVRNRNADKEATRVAASRKPIRLRDNIEGLLYEVVGLFLAEQNTSYTQTETCQDKDKLNLGRSKGLPDVAPMS